jgi:hypothetical protein
MRPDSLKWKTDRHKLESALDVAFLRNEPNSCEVELARSASFSCWPCRRAAVLPSPGTRRQRAGICLRAAALNFARLRPSSSSPTRVALPIFRPLGVLGCVSATPVDVLLRGGVT